MARTGWAPSTPSATTTCTFVVTGSGKERRDSVPLTLIEQEPGCGPPAPVPILQWEKEFSVLLEIYRRSGAQSLLEIGTFHGGTLYHWLTRSQPGTKIVTVDS